MPPLTAGDWIYWTTAPLPLQSSSAASGSWNPVNATEFLEFLLQAMSQRTLWSKLVQQSLCLVECIRVDAPAHPKNLVDTTLHFGFRKQWSTLAEKSPGNSLDTHQRAPKNSILSVWTRFAIPAV